MFLLAGNGKNMETIAFNMVSNKTKEKLLIKDYIETCTDVTIDFIIEFYPGVLNELINKLV